LAMIGHDSWQLGTSWRGRCRSRTRRHAVSSALAVVMLGTASIDVYACDVSNRVVQGEGLIPSDRCTLDELAVYGSVRAAAASGVDVSSGWGRRWTMSWRVGGDAVVVPVEEAAGWPRPGCVPVRRFSWRTRQRHRPGLQFMVSTGRHHGFESLAEQQLLLALDFLQVVDVLSQPFELRFGTADGWASHVPDFLVVGRDGVWLVNVRPLGRVGEADWRCFAAAAEVALAAGWRAVVVSGWRTNVMAVLDAFSAQRRALHDPLMLQAQLLAVAHDQDRVAFGGLVASTSLPVVARAHALQLLWSRRLAVDVVEPLSDRSMIWLAGRAGGAR
jgi:hypothetical protein